jgi:hypothetical protein
MSNNDELRWKQRFENFEPAMKQLESASSQTNYSDLEFAGLIKCFKIAFEMLWKTLKDRFYYEAFDPTARVLPSSKLLNWAISPTVPL